MQRGYGAQMKDMPLPRELFEEQAKSRRWPDSCWWVVEKHSLSATLGTSQGFHHRAG